MKLMGLREFLRGGYKKLDETTVITSHGRAVAAWTPVKPITAAKQSFDHLSLAEREIVGDPDDYDWESSKTSSR